MDDSAMNPMKTGLMFVPLGLSTSSSYPAPSRRPDWVADIAAAALDAHAPAVAPATPRRPKLRWLLALAGGLVPRPRRSAA